MSKVLAMLVALGMFAVLPAVASAQLTGDGGDVISSGNSQDGEAGSGGNAGNQAAIVRQNAGRDANAAVNQQQNFSTGGHHGDRDHGRGRGGDVHGVGGGNVHGVSGIGGVGGVTLVRTGFEAWAVALMGGLSVAGGLGLLAVQRRRAGLSA